MWRSDSTQWDFNVRVMAGTRVTKGRSIRPINAFSRVRAVRQRDIVEISRWGSRSNWILGAPVELGDDVFLPPSNKPRNSDLLSMRQKRQHTDAVPTIEPFVTPPYGTQLNRCGPTPEPLVIDAGWASKPLVLTPAQRTGPSPLCYARLASIINW